jgi:hypothetical protein
MSKLKTLLTIVGMVLISSAMLVSCDDDDDFPQGTMGQIAIHSCQTTSTSATIYWTIVSNDKCDGYNIALYKGTRDNLGAVVEEKTFDKYTRSYTFSNLTPSTTYVVKTQGIPSANSGMSGALEYYKEFTTPAQ